MPTPLPLFPKNVLLRRLLSAAAREALEQLPNEEQRIAFEALGLRVYANGDDHKGWRYEVSL
ncbi:MAG: hypothetical protein LC785_11715 [Acidobacteria bacterium]|nr:hypothetical protein [Acidobacteriota bacterium]MCA1642593.1 hypothetical protein [Acidobacteriota bacterium]